MKIKSQEQLLRQIRILTREKVLLEKRNRDLLKENRLLSAKNQLMESQVENLNKEIVILENDLGSWQSKH